MSNGTFGLDKEVAIVRSGVRQVFTPHTPIDGIKHFFGRENEAARFVSVISTPGQHILVYGDRGVGKTSLAKTTCKVLLQQLIRGHLIEKRCDSRDTFSTVAAKALNSVGVDIALKERSELHNEGGDAGIGVGFARASVVSKRETKTTHASSIFPESPSWVADQLKEKSGIFLIDEVDSLRDDEDRKKLAELIKLLSDFNSQFKVVVVGIASTGNDLTAGHKSVERCLKEVHLRRMSDDDIRKIILNGFNELKMIPSEEVSAQIVDISAGFPHFTHLICLKCAEQAIIGKVRHISEGILKIAMREAVRDSENALKIAYETCLRSFAKPQEYRVLLLAASYCKIPEFRGAELKAMLSSKFGIDIDSALISRRLGSVINQAKASILERSGRGCFRFVDPRMPSFIKMAHDLEDPESVEPGRSG